MKKKFEYMMRYFKSLDCGELEFRIDIDEKTIEYQDFSCKNRNIKELPSTVQEIFDEVCELYIDELYRLGPGSASRDVSSYFYVDIVIDTKNETLIFKDIDFTEYGTESTGTYYEFENEQKGGIMYDNFIKIREFLSKEKVKQIELTYNGGGDSGYIDNTYTTDKGKTGVVPEFLEDIAYYLLKEFGGWEINEGSQGNIFINKDAIEVQHDWNTEESYTNDANITVTKDSFDE